MKDDYTANSHYLTEGWENVCFELGSERLNPLSNRLLPVLQARNLLLQLRAPGLRPGGAGRELLHGEFPVTFL